MVNFKKEKHMFWTDARSENQIVLDFDWDTDLLSHQFLCGTFGPSVSVSCTLIYALKAIKKKMAFIQSL